MYALTICRNTISFVTLWSLAISNGFHWLLPGLYVQEAKSSILTKSVIFLILSFGNCFAEWFFHRDALHLIPGAYFRNRKAPLRWIYTVNRAFATAHRRHHALTPESAYEIRAPNQHASAHFPFWALPAFFGVYLVAALPVKFFFPGLPLILMGLTAVALSYGMYEILHALEHAKFERYWDWTHKTGVIGRICQSTWYVAHRGHHRHHLRNNNVFGLFGFPLADHVFGTLDLRWFPTLDGRLIASPQAQHSRTSRLIAKLDAWAVRAEDAERKEQEVA